MRKMVRIRDFGRHGAFRPLPRMVFILLGCANALAKFGLTDLDITEKLLADQQPMGTR